MCSYTGEEESEQPVRKYTWEEIQKHNTNTSLWVVVHNKVYDVTRFMEEVYMSLTDITPPESL